MGGGGNENLPSDNDGAGLQEDLVRFCWTFNLYLQGNNIGDLAASLQGFKGAETAQIHSLFKGLFWRPSSVTLTILPTKIYSKSFIIRQKKKEKLYLWSRGCGGGCGMSVTTKRQTLWWSLNLRQDFK